MAGKPPVTTGLTCTPAFDRETMCLAESPRPGPVCGYQRSVQADEITPIADYISREMNRNAASADVKRMVELNSFSADTCITDFSRLSLWKQILGLGIKPEQCVEMEMSYHTAALLSFGMKVRQDGDWDHKPKIAARFHPRVPNGTQQWHLYGNTVYYYEVWSNLHYGYAGAAAGFSEGELLDGAGLEQIGSDLFRGNLPSRSVDVSGLRAYDDPHDRAAIEMGIALYKRKPRDVTASDIMILVTTSSTIWKKPFTH